MVSGLDISANGSVGADKRNFTLGWEFSLSEDVMLISLGAWDQGAGGGTQYFGPSLMIKSVRVPEPSTLEILGVSLAGLWMARRRKA
jgi:hypothetical protein